MDRDIVTDYDNLYTSKEVRICESVGKLLASVETNRARIRRACGEEI